MPRLALLLLLALAACGPDAEDPVRTAAAHDASTAARPGGAKRPAVYEMFVRSFTPEGTLRAAQAELDGLQALGIDVVWLMPIHPIGVEGRKGRLGSPYAIRDYTAVDSSLGTVDDVRAFVDAAHARGMRVILDWVANHTARDHPWVTEHPDWYTVGPNGERPTVPEGTDWTDVADLNYDSRALQNEMIAAMRFWVEKVGVDGFRCDVAGFVPQTFWRRAIRDLRRIKPVFMLAEWDEPWVHDVGFDASYSWPTYQALKRAWDEGRSGPFLAAVVQEQEAYPEGALRMHFVTNHDETSWDAAAVSRWNGVQGLRAATVAMYGLPGIPLVYNGQEAASAQRLNLFEDETLDFSGPDLRPFLRQLLDLRQQDPALFEGDVRPLSDTTATPIIGYVRRRGDARAVVLVNPTERAASITLPEGTRLSGLADVFTGAALARTVELEPYGYRLYLRR